MRKYLCMVVKSTNKKEHDIPTIKLSLAADRQIVLFVLS